MGFIRWLPTQKWIAFSSSRTLPAKVGSEVMAIG
jgi:hypothetical protein